MANGDSLFKHWKCWQEGPTEHEGDEDDVHHESGILEQFVGGDSCRWDGTIGNLGGMM